MNDAKTIAELLERTTDATSGEAWLMLQDGRAKSAKHAAAAACLTEKYNGTKTLCSDVSDKQVEGRLCENVSGFSPETTEHLLNVIRSELNDLGAVYLDDVLAGRPLADYAMGDYRRRVHLRKSVAAILDKIVED